MKNSQIVYNFLCNKYPNAKCELNYDSIFQLLISVILSAQCTDERVNRVTPILFKKYPTPFELMNANIEDVESIIKVCGMFHQKAKNIINASKKIVSNFEGNIPNNIEDLMTLDGVGRKTASVVLVEGFSIPAMPVDTHIFRVSKRLGLSNSNDVQGVENDLCKIFPKEVWCDLHIKLIFFGRYFCKAQNPNCNECGLKDVCKFVKK